MISIVYILISALAVQATNPPEGWSLIPFRYLLREDFISNFEVLVINEDEEPYITFPPSVVKPRPYSTEYEDIEDLFPDQIFP